MKTIKKGLLLLSSAALMLTSCTHDDYIPVEGPAGQNGTDGIAGTASCESCHSAEHRGPIIEAFSESVHAKGVEQSDGTFRKHTYGTNTTYADGSLNSNRAFCSQCHSQEGYIDNLQYGRPNPTGYSAYNSISCEGCHGTLHRSLNFEQDGNDYGLRNITAVVQKINPTQKLDVSDSDQNGTTGRLSNTCIGCHQARPDSNGYYKRPVIESAEKDASGNPVINIVGTEPMYTFWSQRKLAEAVNGYPAGTQYYKIYSNTGTSVHASEQGDLWMGINGIDIDGTSTHLPTAKTAGHYTGSSCVKCHIDTPANGKGSHTFKPSLQVCTTCHTGENPQDMLDSFHEEFETELAKLQTALLAKTDYFKASGSSVTIKTTFPTTPGSGNTDPTTWYQTMNVPLKYVQAYWNYKLVSGDEGRGVHNPKYVMALIQNSIEALQN